MTREGMDKLRRLIKLETVLECIIVVLMLSLASEVFGDTFNTNELYVRWAEMTSTDIAGAEVSWQCDGGEWSESVAVPYDFANQELELAVTFAEGEATARVRLYDMAGNYSTWSVSEPSTIDTTPPICGEVRIER